MTGRNGNGPKSEGFLGSLGIEIETIVPLGEGGGGVDRTLLGATDGRRFQLRRYQSTPAILRGLETASRAAEHLADREQLGVPVQGPDNSVVRDIGCPAVLVELPPGATPLPPEWSTGTMIRLATFARELEVSSEGFRPWLHAMDGEAWVTQVEDLKHRAERLVSGRLYEALAPEVVGRLQPIVGKYVELASNDLKEARDRAEAFDSAMWDRAIARGFVVRSPAVEDLFLLESGRAALSWPDDPGIGLAWDGLLGEIAGGTLTDDMAVAVQALVAAHGVSPFTEDELTVLPIYCSPVRRFLDLVEGAIADAPLGRTDVVLRLLDGLLGDPEKGGAWCRFIRSQFDAVSNG